MAANEQPSANDQAMARGHRVTAALLWTYSLEFERYLQASMVDLFFVPRAQDWPLVPRGNLIEAAFSSQMFSIMERWARLCGGAAAKARVESARWITDAYVRRLSPGIDHLVVDQDLLPHIWSAGALRGKTFEVLLTRPPLSRLHQSFDHALEFYPSANSLREYRAPNAIVEAEAEALAACEFVVTAHSEYAMLFPRVKRLHWQAQNQTQADGEAAGTREKRLLLFPSSLAMREGAITALSAAEEIGLPVYVTGKDRDALASQFPDTVIFKGQSEIPWNSVAAVVHPTLFEAWPRLHVQAISRGIPVVGTAACGISHNPRFNSVPFGEVNPLIEAILGSLGGHCAKPSREKREGWASYEPPPAAL